MRQLQYIALYSFRSNSALFQSHFYISLHFAIHLWLALHCCFLFGHVSSFNVSCEDDWIQSKVTGTCLKFFDSPKAWTMARLTCNGMSADLIRIKFDDFNTEVLDYLQNVKNDSDNYHIGLRYRSVHQTWSWLRDPEPITYHDLSSFPPPKHCIYTNKPGRPSWGAGSCHVKKKYICQKPGKEGAMCPPGFMPNQFSGTCFKLNQIPQTYEQSKRKCQENGGDLAMILDENTQAFVLKLIIANNIENGTYVGLDDVQEKGIFHWLGLNFPLTFMAWADGQPGNAGTQGRCVVIDTKNPSERKVWNAVPCDQKAPSICEAYADCKMKKYGAICPVNCSETSCTSACHPRTGSCLECLGPMCTDGDHHSPPNDTKEDPHNDKNASASGNETIRNAKTSDASKKDDVSIFVIIGMAAFGTVVLGIVGAAVKKKRKEDLEKDEMGEGDTPASEQDEEARPPEEPVEEKQEDENLLEKNKSEPESMKSSNEDATSTL